MTIEYHGLQIDPKSVDLMFDGYIRHVIIKGIVLSDNRFYARRSEEIKKQGESKMFDESGSVILESIDTMIDNFSERVLTNNNTYGNLPLRDQLTGQQQDLVKFAIKNETLRLISVLSRELENK